MIEKDPEFYNEAYKRLDKYNSHYNESPYFKMWEAIIDRIILPNGLMIADLGCGVGQFAQMAIDKGVSYSYGVDYSSVAIDKCGDIDGIFYCDDLMNPDVYQRGDYDAAVILEVLEHIENDLDIIEMIPKGREVILSVPNFECDGHVRIFDNQVEVYERYVDQIHMISMDEFNVGKRNNKIFVLYGIRL